MKKTLIFVCAAVALMFGIFAVFPRIEQNDEISVFRLHIRANSNSAADQYIKYVVKDKIIELCSPLLMRSVSLKEAYEFLENTKSVIEEYTNFLLAKQGVSYKSTIDIGKRYFDEKQIDGETYQSGFYDSVTINLGSALGNNWWGLIFPNFSYVHAGGESMSEIVYKSKIMELYEEFIQKN